MKVLFCGPVEDFSGFAHASRQFLRTLNETEFDVVVRPLKYDQLDDGQSVDIEPWQRELQEKTITEGIDVVIQMTTCNIEAQPVPGVMNLLYTFFETDTIPPGWANQANQFDALIVPCRMNCEAAVRSGVVKPVIGMPVPTNRDIYEKEYAPYNLGKKAEGRTIFYNICQISQKKGIDALLRSYYAAFADCPDDALLVLKTYIGMSNRDNRQERETIKGFLDAIWQGCRIPTDKRPPVLPIMGTLTEDEIHGLHNMGGVYVCSSRGEGWGLPVFDALCHGNTVISHTWGGMEQFVSNENALTYGGSLSLCHDMPHPDPSLYTGTQRWFEPSTAELALLMRSYNELRKQAEADNFDTENNANEWNGVLARRMKARELVENYHFENVAPKVEDILNQAFDSFKANGMIKFEKPEEVAQG